MLLGSARVLLRKKAIAPLAAARGNRATLPYLPGLDNLRALAALGVCTYHFVAGLLPEREQVVFIQELFSQVYLGIYIFFVVSGYVLPYSLLRQKYQPPVAIFEAAFRAH